MFYMVYTSHMYQDTIWMVYTIHIPYIYHGYTINIREYAMYIGLYRKYP